MAKAIRQRIGPQQRAVRIDSTKVDKEKRTVELAFSSELPVERWWGTEILSHDQGCCDMARLNNGAPLLLDHDMRAQIGVVERASIDPDKVGRAIVRFGNGPRAQEIFQDVMDGIRSKVSVGYSINTMLLEEMDGDPDDDDDMEETYRAVNWMPYEISLVSIPADDTVGIGRGIDQKKRDIDPAYPETVIELSPTFDTSNMKRSHPLFDSAPAAGGGGASPAPSPKATPPAPPQAPAIIIDARAAEKTRVKEILAIGTRFRKVSEANSAIESDLSVEAFRKQIMDGMSSTETPESSPADLHDITRKIMSLGEQFIRSKQYQQIIALRGKRGEDGEKSRFTLDIPLDGYSFRQPVIPGYEERATVSSSGLTSIQKLPDVVQLGVVPMRVADVIMPGQTSATTVRYIQEAAFTNAADAVAENASIPEETWSLSEVDAAVKKIGTVARETEELMMDYPAVRSYIDQRLQYKVGIKEDSELLNGSGSGAHIKGILNFSGLNTLAFGGPGDTLQDALYKILVLVRTTGWAQPSAYIMHPTDWQNVRLAKDKNSQYLAGGPFTGPYGQGAYQPAGYLWGLPVVETTSIAQGTILTGAFNSDAQIFRRQGLTVEMTNSDASDFMNNRIAIRAYERLALAVYRPLSFATLTGVPTS